MTGRRLTMAVAAVALLAGVIGLVVGHAVANHQFPDVPPGSAFHDDIDAFIDAGCASGFPDGTFHPDEAVKRQQMARFINSCGGRLDFFDTPAVFTLTGTATPVVSVDIESGAQRGGGFVLVQAAVRIFSESTTGFPCDVLFDIPTVSSDEVHLDLPLNTTDPFEDASGFLTARVPVAAGATSNTVITARITNGCTATVKAVARGSAMYFPFDGSGNGGGP